MMKGVKSILRLVTVSLCVFFLISPRQALAITRQFQSDPFENGTESFLPLLANNYCGSLYYDDFSDNTTGWPVSDTLDSLFEYSNGEYHILVRNPDWWVGIRPDLLLTDSILSVEARNTSGVYGTFGLIFGLSEDWGEFYTFEINSEGKYFLYRYLNDEWSLLTEGVSAALKTGSVPNLLVLEREGAQMHAYANGVLLADLTDDSYIGLRYVGLFASSYTDPNVDIRYDNFTYYPATCAPGSVDGNPIGFLALNAVVSPGEGRVFQWHRQP